MNRLTHPQIVVKADRKGFHSTDESVIICKPAERERVAAKASQATRSDITYTLYHHFENMNISANYTVSP